MNNFGKYIKRIGLGLAGAAVLAFGLNHMREASPRAIKTYTENGREITLLDYDGDLSTAEERVTRGRFPAFGSEPPVDGYTERREFEPPVEKDGRKTNTEVSFYDKNKRRVEGPIRTLEPREGRLEIPDEKQEVVSTAEVEQNAYEMIRGYLEKLDASKFSVRAVDEHEYRGEKSFSVDFRYGSEEEGNSILVIQNIDEGSTCLISTCIRDVYYNLTITDYGSFGGFYDGMNESGTMHHGQIEGDDIVIEEVERHCNDPFAKKDQRDNHNMLHDFDDLEVGQRLPGLGKKVREIYEAFNEKAKEAVERGGSK